MGIFSKNNDTDSREFKETTKFGLMKIDDEHKLFKAARKVFKFEDLVSFELVQDNQKVVEGGVGAGRALLGGAFFGNTGAAVGGLSKVKKADKEYCSSIQILFTVRNNKRATHTISVLALKLDKSSAMYSQHNLLAKATLEGFNYILGCNESSEPTDSALANFEDLKKLKELLDLGILTEEEFESKKAELLK
jgi:hypothetical protein